MTGTGPKYNRMKRQTFGRRIERRNGIVVITNHAVVSSTWFWDMYLSMKLEPYNFVERRKSNPH